MKKPLESQAKTDFLSLADEYRRQIMADPKSGLAHEGLAFCLYHLGDTSSAYEEANLTIKMKPDSALAHLVLSSVLAMRKEFEQAEIVARRTIELDSNMWQGYNNLASILNASGKVDEGVLFLKKATDLAPNDWRPYFGASILFLNLKRYSESIQKARKAFLLHTSLQTGYWLFWTFFIQNRIIIIIGLAAILIGIPVLPSAISFWLKLPVVVSLILFEIGKLKYIDNGRGMIGVIITFVLGAFYWFFGHY